MQNFGKAIYSGLQQIIEVKLIYYGNLGYCQLYHHVSLQGLRSSQSHDIHNVISVLSSNLTGDVGILCHRKLSSKSLLSLFKGLMQACCECVPPLMPPNHLLYFPVYKSRLCISCNISVNSFMKKEVCM